MANKLTKEKKPLYVLPRLALVFTLLNAGTLFLGRLLQLLNLFFDFSLYQNYLFGTPMLGANLLGYGILLGFSATIFICCIIFFFMVHKVKSAEKYPRWLAIPVLMMSFYFFYPVTSAIFSELFGGYSIFSYVHLSAKIRYFLPVIAASLPLLLMGVFLLLGMKKSFLLPLTAAVPLLAVVLDSTVYAIEFVMGLLGVRAGSFGLYFYSFDHALFLTPNLVQDTMEILMLVSLLLFLLPAKKKAQPPVAPVEQ